VIWLGAVVAYIAGLYSYRPLMGSWLNAKVQNAIEAERITATEAIAFLERIGAR
jgi:hypothetical protein